MQDLILFVGMVGILVTTSLSVCCRIECFPTSCIENNIIVITYKLIFEKQVETETNFFDVLDSTLEEHQPLLINKIKEIKDINTSIN